MTFSYTSGTTGNPKGAMLTHGNILSVVAVTNSLQYLKIYPSDVHLSYLPLAHIFEKVLMATFLLSGAKVGFYSGDVQKLTVDLADLKPTFFPSVPRLYSRMYDTMKGKLSKLTGFKQTLASYALSSKSYYLKNGSHYTHSIWDKLVFNQIQ